MFCATFHLSASVKGELNIFAVWMKYAYLSWENWNIYTSHLFDTMSTVRHRSSAFLNVGTSLFNMLQVKCYSIKYNSIRHSMWSTKKILLCRLLSCGWSSSTLMSWIIKSDASRFFVLLMPFFIQILFNEWKSMALWYKIKGLGREENSSIIFIHWCCFVIIHLAAMSLCGC